MNQNRQQQGMRRSRASIGLLVMWLGGSLSHAAQLSTAPIALKATGNYTYQADTLGKVKKSGRVTAAGIGWSCSASRCTTRGPWPTPGVAACQALARQVGPIRSYGHSGARLNPAQLKQCNSGVKGGVTVATVKKPAKVGVGANAASKPMHQPPTSALAGPQPKPPTQPDTPAGMGAAGASAVPPGSVPAQGLDNLRNADAARGLSHVRDTLPKIPGAPTRQDNLTQIPGSTLGDRSNRAIDWNKLPGHKSSNGFENPLSRYSPNLPGNHTDGGNNPLVPSSNPQDWTKGASSWRGGRRIDEGGTIYYNSASRPDSRGGVVHSETTYDSSGNFLNSVRIHTRADGSSTETRLRRSHDVFDMRSGRHSVVVDVEVTERDSHGRMTSRLTTQRELGKGDPPARDPGIDRTMDPESDDGQGTAMLCYTMPWKCKIDGIDPGAANRVNPGGREGGGFAPAPQLRPGKSIVVNPDPSGNAPSADNLEAAKQSQKEALQRIGTPGKDPRGDR